MRTPAVTAIVVTYKRSQLLLEAATSVVRSSHIGNIVIVDNNDEGDKELDSLIAHLRPSFVQEISCAVTAAVRCVQMQLGTCRLHYLSMRENGGGAGGFAAGVEYAIHELHDRYCLLMDDDAELATNCVAELVQAAERSQASFVAPLVLNVHSNTHELGQNKIYLDRRTLTELHPAPHQLDLEQLDLQANGFVGVLCPTESLKAIGGVYAPYFITYDDVDTTYRLFLRYGHGKLVPSAVIYHKYRGADGLAYWKCVAEARSRVIFAKRNATPATTVRALIRGLASALRLAPSALKASYAFLDIVAAAAPTPTVFRPERYRSR
jgi:rhamnopyranosyl-N-acetylglucosaminyl-diphospho-decaprenol beta-1,3/1,4-galactofuranosyltransferase